MCQTQWNDTSVYAELTTVCDCVFLLASDARDMINCVVL